MLLIDLIINNLSTHSRAVFGLILCLFVISCLFLMYRINRQKKSKPRYDFDVKKIYTFGEDLEYRQRVERAYNGKLGKECNIEMILKHNLHDYWSGYEENSKPSWNWEQFIYRVKPDNL